MVQTDRQNEQLEQLFKKYYRQLYYYALNLVQRSDSAEEAVQETFRIACEKIDVVINSEDPRSWLTATLKNVIRNMNRKRGRLAKLVAQSLTLDDIVVLEQESSDLEYVAQDVLSPDDYQMLKLSALHGYTMKELAVEFGLSMEACKKRVQRAKKKLQRILNDSSH